MRTKAATNCASSVFGYHTADSGVFFALRTWICFSSRHDPTPNPTLLHRAREKVDRDRARKRIALRPGVGVELASLIVIQRLKVDAASLLVHHHHVAVPARARRRRGRRERRQRGSGEDTLLEVDTDNVTNQPVPPLGLGGLLGARGILYDGQDSERRGGQNGVARKGLPGRPLRRCSSCSPWRRGTAG